VALVAEHRPDIIARWNRAAVRWLVLEAIDRAFVCVPHDDLIGGVQRMGL
jgi:hypothetical protein